MLNEMIIQKDININDDDNDNGDNKNKPNVIDINSIIVNKLNDITEHLKIQTIRIDKIENNVIRIVREFDYLRDVDDKYKEHSNLLMENTYVTPYINPKTNKPIHFNNHNNDEIDDDDSDNNEDNILNCYNIKKYLDCCKCILF
jgi:dsDNA-specific endonuclease/ATPase MutS2